MFGFVLPCKPELKVRDWGTYRACYCGLCKQLGREYGFVARLFLNYDMVLLAMLADGLRGQAGAQQAQCCIVSPVKKRPVCAATPGLALAADALVLTAYYKLLDDLADDPLPKRTAKLALRPVLGRMRKKAAARYPQLDECLAQQTLAQQALEQRACADPDEAADPTARMTAALFGAACTQPSQKAALERMGLFLGKILYYLDAAQDYADDTAHGAYNVFALQGLTREQAIQQAQLLCRMCAGEMALCYNLLDISVYKPILDNIVFLGLPQSIARAGTKPHTPRRAAAE